MRKGSNTVEMRVKTTKEVLKLIKRRYMDRSTTSRAVVTMIQANRQVRLREKIYFMESTNYRWKNKKN